MYMYMYTYIHTTNTIHIIIIIIKVHYCRHGIRRAQPTHWLWIITTCTTWLRMAFSTWLRRYFFNMASKNVRIRCGAQFYSWFEHSCHILPFQPILWNKYFPPEPANTAKHSPKSISEGGRIWQVWLGYYLVISQFDYLVVSKLTLDYYYLDIW